MVRRILLHLPMLALLVGGAHAQQSYNQTSRFLKYNSVWNIYNNIKLNFNTGTVSNGASLTGDEGYASVADPVTGALLFYSDGGKCWTTTNTVMPNGNGLLGNSDYYSSTQGVCIVPIPGTTKKYYLFSLSSIPDPNIKLYYSIVDMDLNGGLGDIVPASKNTLLDGNSMLGEAMLAIQGNNCDIWLMLHTRNTPTFKAYHITTAGINPAPVLSTAGGQVHGSTTVSAGGFSMEQEAYEQSALAVSPNRNKIALSCQHLGGTGELTISASTGRSWGGLLCDFNPNNGIVSNGILFDTLTQYSAAFSPDNTKLYFTSIVPGSFITQLSQVTISSNDSAQIAASKTVIKTPLSSALISVRSYRDSIYVLNPGMMALDRINKPNLTGLACNYQTNVISFPGATALGSTFPNEVVPAADPDTVRSKVLDTFICSKWSAGIKLRPEDQTLENNYVWSNGATDSTITVTAAGIYWVKYGNSCHYRIDTLKLSGTELSPQIAVNGMVLSTTTPFSSYQWYRNGTAIPGATSATYTMTQNGAYTVAVTENNCSVISAAYNATNVTALDEISQWINQISIYPNPSHSVVYIHTPIDVNLKITSIEGRMLKYVKHTKSIETGDLSSGIYLLHIMDKEDKVLKVEKLIRD